MERQKKADERKIILDKSLKTLLFFWQANPDSSEMAIRLGDAIERSAVEGRGLMVKIKEETFLTKEGRNSISKKELAKVTRFTDGDYLFRFKPKTSEEGNVRISVKDLLDTRGERGVIDKNNFVIERRGTDGWYTVAIFRANEIDSLSVI